MSQKDSPAKLETSTPGDSRAKLWIWRVFTLLSVLIFSLVAYFGWRFFVSAFEKVPDGFSLSAVIDNHRPENSTPEKNVRRLVDGVYSPAEPGTVLAVVIDNHPDARPARGLSRAGLVWEALAEGGLTRYLAVYNPAADFAEVGPVRSARPYFLDWAAEFGACFAHCGGSPEALARIAAEQVCDINEFYQGDFFWREKGLSAPHNVMTSAANLRAWLDRNGASETEFFPWLFKDDSPGNATSADLSIPAFEVRWQYEASDNSYLRYLAGTKQSDEDETAIKAKNIAVLFTGQEILDELLRLRIKTVGEGKAIVCQDGQCAQGQWRKPSRTARTRFYNEAGNEFAFNAGQTWIEVLNLKSEVKIE